LRRYIRLGALQPRTHHHVSEHTPRRRGHGRCPVAPDQTGARGLPGASDTLGRAPFLRRPDLTAVAQLQHPLTPRVIECICCRPGRHHTKYSSAPPAPAEPTPRRRTALHLPVPAHT